MLAVLDNMAALIRHARQAGSRKNPTILLDSVTGGNTGIYRRDFASNHINLLKRKKVKKPITTPKHGRTLAAEGDSLAAKGYLRPQKPYSPSADVVQRLDKICNDEGLEINDETRLDDLTSRFKLLNACYKEFNHYVPNSLLHTVETLADLRQFYLTPVNVTIPLDAMKGQILPENLHILYEYHRFNPETDTMFGGKSAFPKSSTIVTGLKYKKKYAGYTAKTKWP
ncbi:39S ribosomal protein L50, mitochondrial [Athalia rosae]|uniref:39S ribosomal protein L50, mitochondrial n=1 Tax=Athalia rosae TaxID=37344 RepID=UPI002033C1BF|nr:39S ribosomal protein L50, mitochondrial [Athalia rosae]